MGPSGLSTTATAGSVGSGAPHSSLTALLSARGQQAPGSSSLCNVVPNCSSCVPTHVHTFGRGLLARSRGQSCKAASQLPPTCTGSTLSMAAPASVAVAMAAREASAAGGAGDAAGGTSEAPASPTKAYDPSGDGGRPTGDSPRAQTSDSDDGTETMHRWLPEAGSWHCFEHTQNLCSAVSFAALDVRGAVSASIMPSLGAHSYTPVGSGVAFRAQTVSHVRDGHQQHLLHIGVTRALAHQRPALLPAWCAPPHADCSRWLYRHFSWKLPGVRGILDILFTIRCWEVSILDMQYMVPGMVLTCQPYVTDRQGC
jgi:hypothetical protein